ncbi:hypothetical protein [Methanofollis ethanolicus]|uniref:hypothetical protein n=1 Tax=Methanofollis ethanolicus TaxID=488124 RepID=UPI0013657EBC|nr:hypothetical protein [Methanofollis ethanolicus]
MSAACRDTGLVQRGRSGSPRAEEIGSFFGLEVSRVRNKTTTLKGFLPVQPQD